jgi:hypothetical protein
MGRPTIQDEFNDFFIWMRDSGRCSPGVAKIYASYMRRISNQLEGEFTDVEKVRAYFANAYNVDQGYAKLRAAWSVFVEWYASEKNQNLPMPDPANLVRVKNSNAERALVKHSELSIEVRRALRVLRLNGITMSQVAKLRWADVDIKDLRSKIVTHVKVPNKNSHWVIPSDAMNVLYNFAKPGLELYKPLVPSEPSSEVPYSYQGLLREVDILTEEDLEEQNAPSDTSALGAALLRKMHKEKTPEPEPQHPSTMTTKDLLRILDAPSRPIPTTYDPANHAVFRSYEAQFRGTPQPFDHILHGDPNDEDEDEDKDLDGEEKVVPISLPRAALHTVPRSSPRMESPQTSEASKSRAKTTYEPSWLTLCGIEDEEEEEVEEEVEEEKEDAYSSPSERFQSLSSVMAYDPDSDD